jgi:hypothetical protein
MFLRYYEDTYRLTDLYKININTTSRTLILYKNGAIFKTYPVAIGKPSNLIPTSFL